MLVMPIQSRLAIVILPSHTIFEFPFLLSLSALGVLEKAGHGMAVLPPEIGGRPACNPSHLVSR